MAEESPTPKPFPSQCHISALKASFTFHLHVRNSQARESIFPVHRTCSVYKEHLLWGLRWIKFYILYNFYITKVQIFEDSAKFILIIMIKKKMSLWQLLFCGLKHASGLLCCWSISVEVCRAPLSYTLFERSFKTGKWLDYTLQQSFKGGLSATL